MTEQEGASSHCYEIQHTSESETTVLLFAFNSSNGRRIVIKLLKAYQDLRFHMATLAERQQCQLEALAQNRRYSPDIYLGLALVYKKYQSNKKWYVDLSEIIEHPQRHDLEEDAEYALVMHWLPKSRRLDYLLEIKSSASLSRYMELLSKTIAEMHEANEQSVSSNFVPQWGGCEQLQKKLDHNLPFRIRVLQVVDDEQLGNYNYLESTFARMGKLMSQALQLQEFRAYFENRVEQHHILRCHGDLKAANIWILAAEEQYGSTVRERVKVLDAIDFNDSYCNIDILADMAMLAVDIEVRTSHEVAQHFIRCYLALTQQEDMVAKAVMTYYLVEKAMIRAIVSYVYDGQPETGLQYVQVAQRHMAQLQRYERLLWYKSLVKEILLDMKAGVNRVLHNAKVGVVKSALDVSDYSTRTLCPEPEPRLDTSSTSVPVSCPEQTIQND